MLSPTKVQKMVVFNCGHALPKSRIGANLAHIPQDSGKRCPECQTKSVTGILGLLRNMQKLSTTDRTRDPGIDQHIVTYAFDRFVSQRKSPTNGFKQRFDEILQTWGETAHYLLGPNQLASFIVTARGHWGSDVAQKALQALGTAALKSNGVYTAIRPAEAELLDTLNRMIVRMRERAASIETFEQLEIVRENAVVLRMLRDDVVFGLSQLEDDFVKYGTK